MILVVSAEGTEDVSFSSLRELEEFVAIHGELLEKMSADELDSSTALLSVFSGPELLASSPQAVKNKATADAKNAGKKLLEII